MASAPQISGIEKSANNDSRTKLVQKIFRSTDLLLYGDYAEALTTTRLVPLQLLSTRCPNTERQIEDSHQGTPSGMPHRQKEIPGFRDCGKT